MRKEKRIWQVFFATVLSVLMLAACGQSKTKEQTEDKQQTDENDMSGDYMGTIFCAEMPPEGSYTLYETDDPYQCIVLYIEKIDDCNIRFYLSKAHMTDVDTGDTQEDVIFKEHVAHYTEEGYFEYIGQEYHLYFRYVNENREQDEENELPAGHTLEVLGLDNLFDISHYGEDCSYNGQTGKQFRYNVPFAG